MQHIEERHCLNCNAIISKDSKFCSKCGAKTHVSEVNHRKEIQKFLAAFLANALYILGLYLIKIDSNYVNALILDGVFFISTLILAILFINDLKPFVQFRKLSILKTMHYFEIQILLTAGVILLSPILTDLFDLKDANIIAPYVDAPLPLLTAILSMAIFPAITEELSFRAILFTQLEKLTSGYSTVIVTGLLFALVHFSFISFIWLIPMGLYLGWIRLREKTIWYGVSCHFLHNFIVIFIDYFDLY
tara:strand:- start:193 stop:933 length:741 start_codon:yes stop_codon:yes gene_type:complete